LQARKPFAPGKRYSDLVLARACATLRGQLPARAVARMGIVMNVWRTMFGCGLVGSAPVAIGFGAF
jgi:hypothetical protein